LEKPRRTWTIWFLDTFKQVCGQATLHFTNLFVSVKLGNQKGLQCEWYLMTLVTDCTIGVLFQYFYLISIIKLSQDTKFEFKTGFYGQNVVEDASEDPESSPAKRKTSLQTEGFKWHFTSYIYQLLIWILIVILAKLTTIGLLLIFSKLIENVGKMILAPVSLSPKLKLVLVMIIFPLFFNILQFWITDNFIKMQQEDRDEILHTIYDEQSDLLLKAEENKNLTLKVDEEKPNSL
jgi:hypothetical protein